MSNENEGWILRGGQRPTHADIPFWGAYHDEPKVRLFYEKNAPLPSAWVAWKPAQMPAPPKPEPTQRDEDEAALTEWSHKTPGTVRDMGIVEGRARSAAWHAALAYRDAQNREDLAPWGGMTVYTTDTYNSAIARLRKRCGLQ